MYIFIVLNSAKVETVTKEQTLTKDKRGEGSKNLPNNK